MTRPTISSSDPARRSDRSESAASDVLGLHHITCISGDPQRTHDFYQGLLGLRLVKKSVNQDDPGTYHLFYADGEGAPGTDITFFPWPQLPQARPGAGLTTEVQLAIPAGTEEWWRERLEGAGVEVRSERRGEDAALVLEDPDGLPLALVATPDDRDVTPWDRSPVPADKQLIGLHGVRLTVRNADATGAMLEQLGFARIDDAEGDDEPEWRTYRLAGEPRSGRVVEVQHAPEANPGRSGRGAVHHVAFAVDDDAHQSAARSAAIDGGGQPTQPIDRFWFRSVYFREPGGVLYELATNGPGFDVDEDLDKLGETLILPPWLEPHRGQIEAMLLPLDTSDERAARIAETGPGAS